MKYNELKQILAQNNTLYLYEVVLSMVTNPVTIKRCEVQPRTQTFYFMIDAQTDEIHALINPFSFPDHNRQYQYLNDSDYVNDDDEQIIYGWAATEKDANDMVEQIKSNVKSTQMTTLYKQCITAGITKNDLLELAKKVK
jgi:hypothetical protein